MYILVYAFNNHILMIGLVVLKSPNQDVLPRRIILSVKIAVHWLLKKTLRIMMIHEIKYYLNFLPFHVCILIVFVKQHWIIHILLSAFLKKPICYFTSLTPGDDYLNWITVTAKNVGLLKKQREEHRQN